MTGRRKRALLVGLAAAGGYGALLRPRLRRWRATDAEVAAPYPGAHLVPGGKRGATMATTIDAPPSQVWPWLVQMGCDRAGWYSWDRLDHGGISSQTRIHPEWQHIQVGDPGLDSEWQRLVRGRGPRTTAVPGAPRALGPRPPSPAVRHRRPATAVLQRLNMVFPSP